MRIIHDLSLLRRLNSVYGNEIHENHRIILTICGPINNMRETPTCDLDRRQKYCE